MTASTIKLTVHNQVIDNSSSLTRFYESNRASLDTRGTAHRLNGFDKTFNDLKNLDQVLELALATSLGTPSASAVVQIPGRYHRLIGTAQVTCELFVSSCLESVVQVQNALDLCNAGSPEVALECLSACEELAARMVESSEQVLKEVAELWEMSNKALDTVTAAESQSRASIEAAVDEKKKLESQQEQAKKNLEDYDASLEKLRLKIKELRKMLPKEEGNAFWGNILVPEFGKVRDFVAEYVKKIPVVGPKIITKFEDTRPAKVKAMGEKLILCQKDIATKHAEIQGAKGDQKKIQDLELAKKKLEIDYEALKKDHRKLEDAGKSAKQLLNEKLSELKEDIRLADVEEQKILADRKAINQASSDALYNITRLETNAPKAEQAKQSLGLCTSTLRKVQYVFNCTRVFWMRMQMQASKLSKAHASAERLLRGKVALKFEDSIRNYGLDWATMGWHSVQAQTKIDLISFNISRLVTKPLETDAERQATIARAPQILELIKAEALVV